MVNKYEPLEFSHSIKEIGELVYWVSLDNLFEPMVHLNSDPGQNYRWDIFSWKNMLYTGFEKWNLAVASGF